MIDVGDGDPPRAGPSGNRDLTKMLTVRCQVAGEEDQRELGCNAHGGAAAESTQNKQAAEACPLVAQRSPGLVSDSAIFHQASRSLHSSRRPQSLRQ